MARLMKPNPTTRQRTSGLSLAAMPMSVHGTPAVTVGETIYIPAGGT